MKRALVCALALVMMVMLAACGGGKNVDVDMNGLAAALLDSGVFTDVLSPVPEGAAPRTYGAAAEDVAACVMYSSTGATAEEIFIAQAVDSAAASRIEGQAHTRMENQQTAFQNYAPEELPKLRNAVIETAGDYVIVVVSGDAAAAQAIVDGYIG